MKKPISYTVLLLCVISVALSSTAFAQTAGPRVELRLIVTDKDGKPLSTIRKEDLHVFEGKIEQTILTGEPDTRPVDLVLALDASGSVHKWFPAALAAASLIVRRARADDEIFIERFISGDKIETVQDFSRDTNLLLKAVDSLYLETGQSTIIDAIYLAVDAVYKKNQGRSDRRKVVIVITDGDERNSWYKPETLVNFLRARGVQVFALALTSEVSNSRSVRSEPSPRERAEKLLKGITAESGGRVFFATDANDLALNAAPQLISQLREQFVIRYQSTNDTGKKGFRRVDVKLNPTNGDQPSIIAPHAYYFPISDPPGEKREQKSP